MWVSSVWDVCTTSQLSRINDKTFGNIDLLLQCSERTTTSRSERLSGRKSSRFTRTIRPCGKTPSVYWKVSYAKRKSMPLSRILGDRNIFFFFNCHWVAPLIRANETTARSDRLCSGCPAKSHELRYAFTPNFGPFYCSKLLRLHTHQRVATVTRDLQSPAAKETAAIECPTREKWCWTYYILEDIDNLINLFQISSLFVLGDLNISNTAGSDNQHLRQSN